WCSRWSFIGWPVSAATALRTRYLLLQAWLPGPSFRRPSRSPATALSVINNSFRKSTFLAFSFHWRPLLHCCSICCSASVFWPFSPSGLLVLPVFVVAAFLSAGGAGLILSALNVSFRDVKYAVPFLVQMGIFVTPVIYPVRYIPPKWQILFGLNPMAGVVLGF